MARIIGGPGRQTALEAMVDLYRTLPEDAAVDWERDSREGLAGDDIDTGVGDPWVS